MDLKRYSKMWAGLASVSAALIASKIAGADVGMIESGLLLVLTGLGVYASPANTPGPQRIQDLRTPWWMVLILAAAVLLFGGCAANPVTTAETQAQRAFAGYGLFVVLEERAAGLMGEPSVPDSVKVRIQRLDARLKPMADSVRDAALVVEDVRAELAAGESTEARLQVVTAELDGWLSRFLPLLEDFRNAVSRG